MALNKTILIGNLVREPELIKTANDLSLCKFAIAVNRRFSKDDEQKVDYLNIVTFKGCADSCGKYLKKGSKVGISGRIQTGSYENKDGNKVKTFDIIADEVDFLTPKSESSSPNTSAEVKSKVEDLKQAHDNSVPFWYGTQ